MNGEYSPSAGEDSPAGDAPQRARDQNMNADVASEKFPVITVDKIEPLRSLPVLSIEKRREYPVTRTFASISGLLGIIGSISGLFLIFGHPSHPLGGSLIIAASWLVALIFWAVYFQWRARKIEKYEAARPRSRTRGRAPDEQDLNQQSLERYQYLTQSQATSSYRLAQAAILVGLLILLGGITITIKTSGTATTQLVVGGLTALGSTISAYVGATSIRIYNRTLNQMNFYYAQPLVRSYVLQAEKLSEKLSADRKDVALEKIIEQTLEGASVAANLIAMVGDTPLRDTLWPRRRERNRGDESSVGNNSPVPDTVSGALGLSKLN